MSHYFLKVTANCADIQNVLARVTRELDESAPQSRAIALARSEELIQALDDCRTISAQEAESVFSALDMRPGYPYAALLLVIHRRVERPDAQLPGSEQLTAILSSSFNEPVRLLRLSIGKYVLLLTEEQARSMNPFLEALAVLEKTAEVRVQTGISQIIDSAEKLPEALGQARCALNACFFSDQTHAVFHHEKEFVLRLIALPSSFIHLPGKFLDAYESKICQLTKRRFPSPEALKKALSSMVVWLSLQADCICDSMEDMSMDCTHLIDDSHTLGDALSRFEQFATEILSLSSFSEKMPVSITSALLYIHSNLDHPLTLNEIARHTHLNPSYLSTLFHKVMRLSPISYINSVRIERAKILLRSTDLPVSRVAAAIGFADDIYFYRLFKKTARETPNEYREHYRQTGSSPV